MSMPRLTSAAEVLAWVAEVRAADQSRVAATTLARSAAWALADGAIRHRSGRFFNVVGLAWDEGGPRHQPFIEQREIGTLGFIARRRGAGFELLVHAKAEPGNIGLVQLAPTCQATASNRDRVHHGAAPPFSGYFSAIRGEVLADTLQSEQGSRFLGKRNRNLFVVDEVAADGLTHRWLPLGLLRRLLLVDYLVNTDARSVLCCTDWRVLGDSRFAALLAAPVRPAALAEARERLEAARRPPAVTCPVERLPGWRFDPHGAATLSDGALALRQIAANCATRETADWDQPILHTLAEQAFDLCCHERGGVLEFGFRPMAEPGLLSGAELGPSEGGVAGRVLAEVCQSDEGGRFYHSAARYRLVATPDVDPSLVWLRLGEVQHGLAAGLFNNEARSALSLVLGLI